MSLALSSASWARVITTVRLPSATVLDTTVTELASCVPGQCSACARESEVSLPEA